MKLPFSLVVVVLASLATANRRPLRRTYDTHDYYVIHRHQNDASLDDIATALGVDVVEQAGELEDHWLVRAERPSIEARDGEDRVLKRFAELQDLAAVSLFTRSDINARSIVDSVGLLERQELRQRVKREYREPRQESHQLNDHDGDITDVIDIHDPLFDEQWHLVNGEHPEHVMNVTGLWKEGITGRGIISSFVDDGLDYTSEDLKENFDKWDSHDFNDHEELPTPKLFNDHHGTRCAGQVAAGRNQYCGLGIAYDSKVAGVRILSGKITDVDEAAALNFGFQNVSIYSCSWGPPDNGRAMEGPNLLIQKAVLNGINKGRGGKGSVFVFASGNGGGKGDQCNFDGYTNSIYSVTVSAIDYQGLHPYYSEACAANMVVAYSSGAGQHIVTTDRGVNACSKTHGGTSAAAPNAAGVFALALSVRPELTWRDIQYLCVETARHVNPDDPDWEPIASGRKYSYKYGFGSLDGYTFVHAAKDWKLVKPQTWFTTDPVQLGNGAMTSKKEFSGGDLIPPHGLSSTIEIIPAVLLKNNFEKLEHITIQVWIQHGRRGDVEVELVSPNNIRSVLGGRRERDEAKTGYPGWTFMTVKHWGEDPIGEWTLKVSDQGTPGVNGTFIGWRMMFWGSTIDASKAQHYELSAIDLTFPPRASPVHSAVPATTKQLSKPTLDPEHGIASGENTMKAFPSKTKPAGAIGTNSPSSSSTALPTLDEAWLGVSSSRFFFGAMFVVTLFAIGAAIFFWRRRQERQRRDAGSEYSSLPHEPGSSMAMTTRRAPTTKALYDALGELSDEEEGETSRLNRRTQLPSGGFHSGFLDDDEPPSAMSGAPSAGYRDEPAPAPARAKSPSEGSGSGSGDGSWEHAS